MSARPGYDAATWRLVKPFDGHCAAPHDLETSNAVFALGDTFNGRVIEMDKPCPVIWYAEDEEFAALLVQAEAHEDESGEPLEMAGLMLPNGDTAVARLHEIEIVDDTDPVWLALLEAEEDDDDLDGEDDEALWAEVGLGEDDDEL